MDLKPAFRMGGTPHVHHDTGDTDAQLGNLASLLGPLPHHHETTWIGTGFNIIWRPLHATGAHFLELNLTQERLDFKRIAGSIPNRGLLNQDISMFGVQYLNQISDTNNLDANGNPTGLHFEPGMWVNVPPTTNPFEGPTVVRMGSIPHGTVINMQGLSGSFTGLPDFRLIDTGITPFSESNPAQTFPPTVAAFDQPNLSITGPDTANPPQQTPLNLRNGITQAMVDDPSSVLKTTLAGHTVLDGKFLLIGTANIVGPGGGTANTAFLGGEPQPLPAVPDAAANANAVTVTAAFWPMTVRNDANGYVEHWLQYEQRVVLNFAGLGWPHITVATLKLNPGP